MAAHPLNEFISIFTFLKLSGISFRTVIHVISESLLSNQEYGSDLFVYMHLYHKNYAYFVVKSNIFRVRTYLKPY